jgi:ligand-binding sensor domain-containing protein
MGRTIPKIFHGCAALAFMIAGLAMGAPDDYSSRVWQTDEGLPNNRVLAIAQTTDGFLWVGTSDGLARFDGVEFKTFNAANTPQLRSSAITALSPGADDSLWIGTKAGGLVWLHRSHFSQFTSRDGLVGNNVRVLASNRDTSVWIGTTQGLSRYYQGKFQTFTSREHLLSDVVTALCPDQEGVMWVATSKGLNQIRDRIVETPTVTGDFASNPVRSLWFDGENRLWIGTEHGLLCYDSGTLRTYTTREGLSENFVTAIRGDSRTNLWVGTSSGLSHFLPDRFQAMLNGNGIPYDQVNTLFEDTRGDIWVGSREGLIRLTRKPFSVLTRREGLSYNNLTSVLEDRRHQLWVGTWGAGLDKITAQGVEVYGRTNHLSSDWIKALAESHDGSIWAGADNNGGLFRISDGQVIHYGIRDGLVDTTISVLHEDRESNLWIGTRLGLCRRSQGNFTTETNAQNRPIWAICEDSHGTLWFGGDAGLFRRRNGAIENLVAGGDFPAKSVSALYADAEDNVWVGSRAEGLIYCHGESRDRFGVQDGLYSNEVLGIAEDHGWLWMTSTKGVFRVRKEDLEAVKAGGKKSISCITYGRTDGLESIVCGNWSAPTICKTSEDRMYFATTIGLAVLDARDISVDLSPPPVYIEQIQVDRRPVSWRNVESPAESGRIGHPLYRVGLKRAGKMPFQVPPRRRGFRLDRRGHPSDGALQQHCARGVPL